MKFVTPRTQRFLQRTLRVFHKGEAEFEVSTTEDEGSEPTYDADFETTDYEREVISTLSARRKEPIQQHFRTTGRSGIRLHRLYYDE